jgi:glycosyltransferase involved in cell wall biosynthesis
MSISEASAVQKPLVSIIVPARNEADHIGDLLQSIAASTYPLDRVEVIIVDSQSTDGTADVVQSFIEVFPRLRTLPNPAKITPIAFNVGVRAAAGDYITILSGHSTIDPGYIADTVDAFDRLDADVVGGRVTNVGYSRFGRILAALLASSLVVGDARFRYSEIEGPVDTVLGTYRREVFERVGLFDERLLRNQDNEFNSRVRLAGFKIYLVPKLTVRYRVRRSLFGAGKQFFGNGRWNVYVARMNRQAIRVRHFVPAIFVSLLILMSLIGVALHSMIPITAILIPYAAIVTATAATVRLRMLERFAVFVVQPILHVSYGIGSIVGLLTRLPIA